MNISQCDVIQLFKHFITIKKPTPTNIITIVIAIVMEIIVVMFNCRCAIMDN